MPGVHPVAFSGYPEGYEHPVVDPAPLPAPLEPPPPPTDAVAVAIPVAVETAPAEPPPKEKEVLKVPGTMLFSGSSKKRRLMVSRCAACLQQGWCRVKELCFCGDGCDW